MAKDKEEDKEEKLSAEDLDFGELDDPTLEIDEDLEDEEEKKETKPDKEEEEEEPLEEELDSDEDDSDEDDSSDDDSDDKDEDEDSGEEQPRIVDVLIQSSGFEFEEDELEGLEDTEEGLISAAEKIGQKIAKQEVDRMVEASPNTKALYEYEQTGGEAKDFIKAFYPPTDYSKVEVDEDDIDSQKEIIKASLESKGLEGERIKRNLQAIEDSGNLLDEAKDSLKDLRQAQQDERERIKEETERRREESIKKAEEEWEQVDTIIDNGNIKDLPVPKAKKKEFRDFITPDETGVSERDKRQQKMTLEDHLAMDLILFYGFDNIAKLIDTKASSKNAKSLRDKLKSSKDRGGSDRQDPELDKAPDGDVENLEFRIDENE